MKNIFYSNQVCTNKGKCHCQGNLDPETACRTGKTGITPRFLGAMLKSFNYNVIPAFEPIKMKTFIIEKKKI